MKRIKCEFGECKLPKNNRKYGLQFICLGLALIALAKNVHSFDALNILLFVLPISLDYAYNLNDIEYTWYKKMCWLGLTVSLALIFICFGVFFELLIDQGTFFAVGADSLVPYFRIEKIWIYYICLSHLFGPALFWWGCSSQETLLSSKIAREVCVQK